MIQALDIWLPAWRRREKYFQHALGVRHVMIAICDDFGPASIRPEETRSQLARWKQDFRGLREEFKDADGVSPKHTFFFPIEQYDSGVAADLAELGLGGGCETEIELHHDNDTPENLRSMLRTATERLSGHGLLSRDATGAVRYGFMHGHGALDHSHPEGRHCGVCNELAILRETGCYADFTLPTAPARTQTRMINSLYYARSTDQGKSHDKGRRAQTDRERKPIDTDDLLLVQGPLALDRTRKRFGFLPRIENGELSAEDPPTAARLRVWIDCRIAVEGRPNWIFVKLRVRGSSPENLEMLLGPAMRDFHRAVAEVAEQDATLRFHYVTAREMVNILHAAESGHSGEPGRFRDYRYRRESAAEVAVTT